mgnify:CR=1 FL=1
MQKLRFIIRIVSLLLLLQISRSSYAHPFEIRFYGDTLKAELPVATFPIYTHAIDMEAVRSFYAQLNELPYQPILHAIRDYKQQHQLSDWIYYQLIRKTAQELSPKEQNYNSYTLYKWFFLSKSGYDARLAVIENKLLFYVETDENIYDIPSFERDGKQFICLNYHDFGKIDFTKDLLLPIELQVDEAKNAFSYKIEAMPDLVPGQFTEKDIRFSYKNKVYKFKVVLNPDVPTLFKNYPVTDFESYFNIPMSPQTYNSLIPSLKKAVSKMSMEQGVDYLMEFTRNAFLYESDEEAYGKEKRLSPELTLFSKYSDCDDRAAFFFYIVKEIYNRPMIVLLYPTHVTVAVNFDKPLGNAVYYKNHAYAVCDPTPQLENMPVGELSPRLKDVPYTIAYEYSPGR